jgi:RimJ/RimL family protein N-acetyltransferase
VELELRPYEPGDAAAVNAAVEASREHLRPWMAWASELPMTLAARRAWIAGCERRAAAGEERFFGIWREGELVGSCGLHRRVGPGGLEVGYWVHAAHVRRGIATAAVRLLVDVAFAEPSVTRLEIHHDAGNAASGAVARAAGFTHLEDRPRRTDLPTAPADGAVERVWCLRRLDASAQ